MFNREAPLKLVMKGLSQTQLEQLQNIGAQLAQERERKRIPLDEVALKTYIPLRQLQALEVGNTEILPEPIFVQGFIRRYADALGLDGTALAQAFDFQPTMLANPALAVDKESALPPTRQLPAKRASAMSPPKSRADAETPGLNWFVLGLLSLGALLLGGALYNFYESSWGANKRVTVKRPAATIGKPAQPSQASPNPIAASTQPTPLDTPIQVSVKTTGDAWLKVVVDQRQPAAFEETVTKGFSKTWTATKSLQITAGDAGNVQVSFNQAEPKVLGEPGQPKKVTYASKPSNP